MKVSRPKTEKWHNWEEGEGIPNPKFLYFKKKKWKRWDRKKFFRRLFKNLNRDDN